MPFPAVHPPSSAKAFVLETQTPLEAKGELTGGSGGAWHCPSARGDLSLAQPRARSRVTTELCHHSNGMCCHGDRLGAAPGLLEQPGLVEGVGMTQTSRSIATQTIL